MTNDGTLTLNAQGLKCRDKNNDGDTQDTGECGMGEEWNYQLITLGIEQFLAVWTIFMFDDIKQGQRC